MDKDIPSNENNLTDPEGDAGKPKAGDPMQPTNPEEELDSQSKKDFQIAIQKKSEALKAAEKELAELREEKRLAKLAELSETERLQVERDQLAGENAKLKMSQFAQKELAKRNILPTDPIYDIIVETPWSVPAIKRSLGDSPSWANVVQVVEEKLPSYLDSLASNRGETRNDPTLDEQPESPITPVVKRDADPERQPVTPSKRTWSRKEIAALSEEDYKKHRLDILKAQAEGRIIS